MKNQIMKYIDSCLAYTSDILTYIRKKLGTYKPKIRTEHQQKVLEFNTKAGISRPDKPSQLSKNAKVARARLIIEEALEVIDAMGLSTLISANRLPSYTRLTLNDFVFDEYKSEVDLAELAKEFADLHVVTTGAEQSFGIDLGMIQDAVDDNNLAKFGPGSYVNEHGKLVKPKDHPKPNITTLLQEQLRRT